MTLTEFILRFRQQYKRRHRRSMGVAPPTQFIEFRDDLPISEAALLQKGSVVPTLVFKSGSSADGRENKYANSRKMDARPLPSIPDLRSGSWKMVAADPGSVAALHRMNSGHRQSRMIIRSCGPDGFRRSSAGPRPGSTCTVYSQTDPHQYFVLEPEEPTGTGRDIREMILLQERQTIPRAHFHPKASVESIDDSLENIGGVGIGGAGNIMITSIHEIPVRSPQSQLALTQGVSTGPSTGRPT